jgi:hypothetical protein
MRQTFMQANSRKSNAVPSRNEARIPVAFEPINHESPEIITMKAAQTNGPKSSFGAFDLSHRGVPFSPLND